MAETTALQHSDVHSSDVLCSYPITAAPCTLHIDHLLVEVGEPFAEDVSSHPGLHVAYVCHWHGQHLSKALCFLYFVNNQQTLFVQAIHI